MAGSLLGTAVRRVEDPDLIVGRGTFVDNVAQTRDDVLHGVFVRSPFARADISGLDTSAAAAAPGVVGVFTAADLGDRAVPAFASANDKVERFALARRRVQYVGDPVALVVAESRALAVDAAELVDVDYEPLPFVVDMERAADADAPQLYDELPHNVAIQRIGEGDPLDGAEVVVRARIENNRLATAPIEGNAVLADPTAGGHRLTVWLSTQHPHLGRELFSELTGLDEADIRVVAPHVGGAFGGKAGISSDHAAIVSAALALGRPVTWAETRSEAMLSMHGRGQVQYAELGLTRDGRITGLRARVIGDCGAYAGFGGSFAAGSTRTMAQGPYVIPQIRYDALSVVTSTSPGRCLPRRRPPRGRRAARADPRRRRRRARPGAGGDPAPQLRPRRRLPLDDVLGEDLRLRRLRPAADRSAAPGRRRRRPRRAGPPSRRR